VIAQCLYVAFKSGRLLMFNPETFEGVQIAPNLNLVDAVDRTFADAERYYDDLSEGKRGGRTFRSARINFLKEAVVLLYNYGKFDKAKEYFEKLIKEDGREGRPNLETFVLNEWSIKVKEADVKTANSIISGLIYQSIYYLLYDETDAALAQERLAQAVYRNYMKEFGDSERTRLAPYKEMKRNVVDSCLRTFPPMLSQMLRAKIAAEQKDAEDQAKYTVPGLSGLPGLSGGLPMPQSKPEVKK
jgi:tetratricopeptide (TPR) repeat protein